MYGGYFGDNVLRICVQCGLQYNFAQYDRCPRCYGSGVYSASTAPVSKKLTNPFDGLRDVPWQEGPPDAPGLWFVDTGAKTVDQGRYGCLSWVHDRATARWVDPEKRGVAVSARQEWPAKWKVFPAMLNQWSCNYG